MGTCSAASHTVRARGSSCHMQRAGACGGWHSCVRLVACWTSVQVAGGSSAASSRQLWQSIRTTIPPTKCPHLEQEAAPAARLWSATQAPHPTSCHTAHLKQPRPALAGGAGLDAAVPLAVEGHAIVHGEWIDALAGGARHRVAACLLQQGAAQGEQRGDRLRGGRLRSAGGWVGERSIELLVSSRWVLRGGSKARQPAFSAEQWRQCNRVASAARAPPAAWFVPACHAGAMACNCWLRACRAGARLDNRLHSAAACPITAACLSYRKPSLLSALRVLASVSSSGPRKPTMSDAGMPHAASERRPLLISFSTWAYDRPRSCIRREWKNGAQGWATRMGRRPQTGHFALGSTPKRQHSNTTRPGAAHADVALGVVRNFVAGIVQLLHQAAVCGERAGVGCERLQAQALCCSTLARPAQHAMLCCVCYQTPHQRARPTGLPL